MFIFYLLVPTGPLISQMKGRSWVGFFFLQFVQYYKKIFTQSLTFFPPSKTLKILKKKVKKKKENIRIMNIYVSRRKLLGGNG